MLGDCYLCRNHAHLRSYLESPVLRKQENRHDADTVHHTDFYEWDASAAPDRTGMWANVYVCVGLAGPVVTFSGVPPQPT